MTQSDKPTGDNILRSSDVHIRRQALNAPRWLTTLNGPMLSAVVGGSLVAFVFISAFAG